MTTTILVLFFPFLVFVHLAIVHLDCDSEPLLSSISVESDNSYLLRRGCTWHDGLNMNSVDNVVIGAYGDDSLPLPLIDLSVSATLVESLPGIYRSSDLSISDGILTPLDFSRVELLSSSSPPITATFFNYTRFPREHNDWFYIPDGRGAPKGSHWMAYNSTVLPSASLSSLPSTYAFIIARLHHWAFWGSRLEAVYESNETVSFQSTTFDYGFPERSGFKVAHVESYGGLGDWWFDVSTHELQVWWHAGLGSVDVRLMASNGIGINIEECGDVSVSGVSIRGAESGVRIFESDDVNIRECEIDLCEIGVVVPPTDDRCNRITIERNLITETHVRAVEVLGWDVDNAPRYSRFSRLRVEANVITGLLRTPFGAYPRADDDHLTGFGRGTGIFVYAADSVVSYNTLDACGYSCVIVAGVRVTVEHNSIEHACLFLDDGGGIYIGGSYHTIRRNVVRNVLGWSYGTQIFVADPLNVETESLAVGIYADDGSGNITIEENFVENTHIGILLHNSMRDVVRQNSVFRARKEPMIIQEDVMLNRYGWTHGHRLRGNVFHTANSDAEALRLFGMLGFVDMLDELEENVYSVPVDSTAGLFSVATDVDDFSSYQTLEEWRECPFLPSLATHDLDSSVLGEGWYNVVPFVADGILPNLVANGDFDVDATGWFTGDFGFMHTHWSSEFGGTLRSFIDRLEDKTSEDILTVSEPFAIQAGRLYEFRAELICNDTDFVFFVVRKCGDDFLSLGYWAPLHVTEADAFEEGGETYYRKQVSSIFTGSLDHADSCVWVHSGEELFSEYFLDEIGVFPVENVLRHDYTYDFFSAVNPTGELLSIPLANPACDVHGNVIDATTIDLPAHTGQVLVRCFCNMDYTCNNHENANTCPGECSPVCGNSVCEKAEESWTSCPSDCLNVATLVGAIVGSAFGIVVVVFFVVLLVLVVCVCFRRNRKRGSASVELRNKRN